MKEEGAVRLRTVDVARGIAIISVILGHLGSSEINRVVFTYHLPVFYLIIVCKLLLDLGAAAVLSRIGFVRNLFGIKSKQKV